MTSGQFQRLDDLFRKACALDPSQRESFLNEACAGDADMRGKLQELLEHDQRPPAYFETLTHLGVKAVLRSFRVDEPLQIGRYRILGLLGEGGMGKVFRAEQDHPKRLVALKMIRPGVVSPGMVKRFVLEAQALGRLQHPGIAQIFEAGTVDIGGGAQPYFAMELIEGQSLLAHAQSKSFGTRDRVSLLVKIAQAVHHAHERGVIHRDLKPGNILVDDSGQPKVLDFGVARITDPDVQMTTMRTDIGQLVGTLPYMSPEQLSGGSDGADLDARCDVYALGVMLYELLTDRLPFNVRDKSLLNAAQIIRDHDPTPLSSVSKTFGGDLNTIVSKALEKDRARRYQTAADLADDLEHYLHAEPIVARRATTIYQLRKFAQRNRVLVAGVATTMLALVIGIIVSTLLYVQSQERKDVAEWNAYISGISAAEASIRVFDVGDARRGIDQAPARFRNWEWRHLSARLDRSLLSLPRHPYAVTSSAWSGDGGMIATGCDDGVARLWNAENGVLLHELRGHTATLAAVEFNPSRTILATASLDHSVRLWQVKDGQQVAQFHGDTGQAWALGWHPNGQILATAGSRGTIFLWDASGSPQSAPIATLFGHTRAVQNLVFVADGSRLVSLAHDGSVCMWDVHTRQLLRTLTIEDNRLRRMAVSRDGSRIALAMVDGQIHLWDGTSNQSRWFASHSNEVLGMTFDPSGQRLILAGLDRSIRRWDMSSGQCLGVLLGHEEPIRTIALSPDGQRLVSGANDGVSKIWRIRTDDVPTLRGHRAWVYSMAFSPDGTILASAGGEYPNPDGMIRLWNVKERTELLAMQACAAGQIIYCVAFSPDGKSLASTSGDRTVRRWNVKSGVQTASLELPRPSGVACFTPDGSHVIVDLQDPSTESSEMLVIDESKWKITTSARVDSWKGAEHPFDLSRDGRLIAAGASGNEIVLLSAIDFRPIRKLIGHEDAIHGLSFNADATLLASAAMDKTVRLWNVSDGREVAVMRGHTDSVDHVKFLPTGDRLASVSEDGTLRLWDTVRHQQVAVLHGHSGLIKSLAISPDGRTIATGSGDCTIRLWEAP